MKAAIGDVIFTIIYLFLFYLFLVENFNEIKKTGIIYLVEYALGNCTVREIEVFSDKIEIFRMDQITICLCIEMPMINNNTPIQFTNQADSRNKNTHIQALV